MLVLLLLFPFKQIEFINIMTLLNVEMQLPINTKLKPDQLEEIKREERNGNKTTEEKIREK